MRHWRIPTWLIVGWTVLMAAWVVVGVSNAGPIDTYADETRVGVGISIVFSRWLIGVLLLGVLWYATKPGAKL